MTHEIRIVISKFCRSCFARIRSHRPCQRRDVTTVFVSPGRAEAGVVGYCVVYIDRILRWHPGVCEKNTSYYTQKSCRHTNSDNGTENLNQLQLALVVAPEDVTLSIWCLNVISKCSAEVSQQVLPGDVDDASTTKYLYQCSQCKQ